MQSVDCKDLDRLLKSWNRILKEYPVAKRNLLNDLGQEILKDVQANIRASGMRHGGGRLANWQHYYIGSFLGYTAVRAVGSKEGFRPGDNSPGAITNYTENGHRIRRPDRSGTRSRRYRPEINVASVSGYHYYHSAKFEAKQKGEAEVRALAEALMNRLGGAS